MFLRSHNGMQMAPGKDAPQEIANVQMDSEGRETSRRLDGCS